MIASDTGDISQEIYDAFQMMKLKDFGSAEILLREGLKKAEEEKHQAQQALFYSTLGVLEKLKGNYKEAWRDYERAEKLLPDDPSLKIIMAKLLIDQFSQYDAAIKKLKKVLEIAKGSGSFEHQAHATMAIAYLKKGEKTKAVEMFDLSVGDDFDRVATAENLNFEVIASFLSRNLEVDRCRRYVEKALHLAKKRQEGRPIQFLKKLLDSFEVTRA